MIFFFLLSLLKTAKTSLKYIQNEQLINKLKEELNLVKLENSCRILKNTKNRIEFVESEVVKKLLDKDYQEGFSKEELANVMQKMNKFLDIDNKNCGLVLEMLDNYSQSKILENKVQNFQKIFSYMLSSIEFIVDLSGQCYENLDDIKESLKGDSSINLDELTEKIDKFSKLSSSNFWDHRFDLIHDSDDDNILDDVTNEETIILFESDLITKIFN